MINCFLDLNTTISTSSENITNGYKASSIANLIAGTPYFNGELKLRGELIPTGVNNHKEKILSELSKIRTLDVSELTGLKTRNNFTDFCRNITEYKGISKEDLIWNTSLNINKVDFQNYEVDLNEVDLNEVTGRANRWRLHTVLENGAKVKHFKLTPPLAIQLGSLLYSYTAEPVIKRDFYDLDDSQLLDISNVSEELIDLGFKFKPCHLKIEDEEDRHFFGSRLYSKITSEDGVSCSVKRLDLLLELGCTVEATITDIRSEMLDYYSEEKYSKVIYNIPRKLYVDVERPLQVNIAAKLPVEMLRFCKKVKSEELYLSSTDSIKTLEVYAALGIEIQKPASDSPKYMHKLYNRYIEKCHELS